MPDQAIDNLPKPTVKQRGSVRSAAIAIAAVGKCV